MPIPGPTLDEALEYADELPADCFADRCIITLAAEVRRLRDTSPKSGDVLISSPLGTQQLACGNRVPVETPTTIRVE